MYVVTVFVYCPFVLYTVLCMLVIELLVHVILPSLVSMNSSSDDLNESVYYKLLHKQYINILRILEDSSFEPPLEFHFPNCHVFTKGCNFLPLGISAFLIEQAHPERCELSL